MRIFGDPSGIRTPDTLIKSFENSIPASFIKTTLRLYKSFNYAVLECDFLNFIFKPQFKVFS